MESDEFVNCCRSDKNNVFVRNRKMPLNDLLLTMVNKKGITLTLELRNYMKIAHPGVNISKPGYLKQRMKLNPNAFQDLYHFHNQNFYSEPVRRVYPSSDQSIIYETPQYRLFHTCY